MQTSLLFELIPIIAFFAAYYLSKNIFMATLVCIIASYFQLLLHKIKYKKIPLKLWISTLLITILGGFTIALHNKAFVMLKPTALFWLIGISMLIGQLVGKNGLKLLLQKELELPNKSWDSLNIAWGIFFIVLGIMNLIVAFNCPEYTWVKFKTFGSPILMTIFTLITSIVTYLRAKSLTPRKQ